MSKMGLLIEVGTMIMCVAIAVMFISIGIDNALKTSSRIVQVESFYVVTLGTLMLIAFLSFFATVWISRFICK